MFVAKFLKIGSFPLKIPFVAKSHLKLQILKQGYLLVSIKNQTFRIFVYVVNNLSSDLILGTPFLKENKAVIDFERKTLCLRKDGEVLSSDLITPATPPSLLSTIHSEPFQTTVRAVGTIIIPPLSTVQISVTCEAPNFQTKNKFFEPITTIHNSTQIFMPRCN